MDYHGFMRLGLAGLWDRSVGGRKIDAVRVPGSYPPVGECRLARRFSFPAGFSVGSRRRQQGTYEGNRGHS